MQNSCSKNDIEFAGFWVRFAAYLIDMAIVSAALLIVRLILTGVMSLLSGTFLDGGILFHYTLKDIILYLLQVLYFILFTYHTGTTLGKKALNLRVVSRDGEENLSLINVIYRETIGRFLCGLIAGIGYIIAGLDKEKRGLHDILCDTRVIYAKKIKVYQSVNPIKEIRETEEDSVVKSNTTEDVARQWEQILNPQKEEINSPCEEENIEGNS